MQQSDREFEEELAVSVTVSQCPEYKLEEVVRQTIEDPMRLAPPLLRVSKPNFVPITFTLWRRLAL